MNKFVLLLYGAVLSGGPMTSLAQSELSLDQAIIQVLENHPRLKIADYEAQAMAARIRQVRQQPPVRATLALENFAGTGETVAARGIEATLSLSRTLELGNKAVLRGDVMQGEMNLLHNQKDIDRLNLLADTAQRFLHVAADQERLRLVEEALELIELTGKTVDSRVQAGRVPETERQRVAIDLANHRLELEHTRHELENSRVSLATLWGARQLEYGRVVAEIYGLNEPGDFSELTSLLDRNPHLTRYVSATDLARAKIKLMQSRRVPDVDISAGMRYLGGTNDVAAMLWASIPLGSAGRAQPGIEEAESLASIDPLSLEQKKLELYATLFEVYQEMRHAREAVETLNDTIIPAARQMLQDYENGYGTGRYSLLELIQAQQLLRNARTQLLESAVSFHSHRIEIDRLTGAQITQW